MVSSKPDDGPVPLRGFVLLWLGVLVLMLDGFLKAAHVWGMGDPHEDPLGGLIALIAFILIVWGVVSITISLVGYSLKRAAKRRQ